MLPSLLTANGLHGPMKCHCGTVQGQRARAGLGDAGASSQALPLPSRATLAKSLDQLSLSLILFSF